MASEAPCHDLEPRERPCAPQGTHGIRPKRADEHSDTMVAVSGHCEHRPLCLGSTMLPAAEEAIAHRHRNRSPPFFELHDGRTMVR